MGAVSSPRLGRHDLNQTEAHTIRLDRPNEHIMGADNIARSPM